VLAGARCVSCRLPIRASPCGEVDDDGESTAVALTPQTPFGEEVFALMTQEEITLRELAARIEMSPGHLSRILRGDEGKQPTREALERLAAALNVPPDHFGEYRAIRVSEAVREDPKLRDRLYRRIVGG
jgi:DNA-binding Xre family transcriptional regulator